jgi:DNA-binding CsgD family transcriptional regulator
MSVSQAPPDLWRLDVGRRQRALAVTQLSLTSALCEDSGCPAIPTSVLGSGAAPATDAESLAALLDDAAPIRALVSTRLLRQLLMSARRVNDALDRLHAVTTYVDLVRAVPSELCWAGDFERVLFSQVDGATWSPTTWHATRDAQGPEDLAFGEFIHGATLSLACGTLEAEVVRRRMTALVGDVAAEPRIFEPIAEIALSPAYVIAPVLSGDRVVGLLHADTGSSGRHLTEADRVALRAFADGMGLAMERLLLLQRLASQREEILEALAVAAKGVDDICLAPVQLNRRVDDTAEALPTRIGERCDDGLTTREREVFALLVGGATNGQIADRLTVSATTVKSHVKHILRKLKVTNRAEAIAQYLRVNGNALARS